MPRLAPLLESSWIAEACHADIQALRDVLLEGEEVLFLGRGYLVRQGWPAVRRWTIAATSERLLCIRPGISFLSRLIDIPRHTILQVIASRALSGSHLDIRAKGHNIRLQLPREHLIALEEVLTEGETSVARPIRSAPRSLKGRAEPGEASRVSADTARIEYLELAVERLETELSRLQQQTDFMEEIMRKKATSYAD